MKCCALIIASLSVLVTSKSHEKPTEWPLEVSIESQEGSLVNLRIDNHGGSDVHLFSRASILDPNPIRKLNLTTLEGAKVPFIGAHARVALENLDKKSFSMLKKNKFITTSIDLAYLYDIQQGGSFVLSGEGGIPWAWHGNTRLAGEAPYRIPPINITVQKLPLKPKINTAYMSDCVGAKYDDLKKAEAVCAMLSIVSGNSALHGDPDQFYKYFRTYDKKIRTLVAKRYYAVSDECSGKSKVSTTYCTDAYLKLCKTDYISVTLGTQITTCDLYWRFPTLTSKCHDYDQATLTIHETTHVDGVFDPSTDDLAYGWPKISALTANQAIRNGETYAHYANAVYAGC